MIRATDHQAPGADSPNLFENWDRFGRGDVYCSLGWGGSQKRLRHSTVKGRLAFGPTPGGMVRGRLLQTPYFNWGWNYVVPSASAVPEIAYLFALFASSPTMSTLAVRQEDGFFDPFRPEHYDDPGIRETYSQDFLKVHRTSLEGAIPDLYLKYQSEYFRILSDWLHRAITGEVRPTDALERAAHRWTQITERAGARTQAARWGRLRRKYPAPIRNVLRDL